MCSPELWQGLCCICYGTLTFENALYADLGEGRGGVHRGKCAILAGIVPEEHIAEHDRLIRHIHNCPSGPQKDGARREYYAFVDGIATEDQYIDLRPE